MLVTTISGVKFDLLLSGPADVRLTDIVTGLSNQGRFNGQTSRYYSVAEHSVLVADLVADLGGSLRDQMHGLFHDATEAYMGDLVSPIKARMPEFKRIEQHVWRCAIAPAFDLDPELPEIVHKADGTALSTEYRCLLPEDMWWKPLAPPSDLRRVAGCSPSEARSLFLAKFVELSHALRTR